MPASLYIQRSTANPRHTALFLTTWHMVFATAMTQGLAKFTTILDSRHKVPMTPSTYA
jgi:hypothetical protein